LSQPAPMRRASLLLTTENHSSYETKILREDISFAKDTKAPDGCVGMAGSLAVQTPSPTPSSSPNMMFPSQMRTDDVACRSQLAFEDPLLLLHWLTQIDLSSYGFGNATKGSRSDKTPLDSLNVSSIGECCRIEQEFLEAVRQRRQRQGRIERPTSSPPSAFRAKSPSSSIPSLSPRSTPAPRVPYKGRFGLHPVCGSCKTNDTPYWRDSWSPSFILCNACGLRYSKFKRYCCACCYIPRKEDKGSPCCTKCSSPWSFKS